MTMAQNDTGQQTLVTGATGETGRRVVTRLLKHGVRVRALMRSPEKACRFWKGADVELHAGDIRDPATLQGMADGVDHVIHTIGTRTYLGTNGGAAVDVEGTKNLVHALAPAKPHLVFLSAFGVGRSSPLLSIFSTVLGNYFRHKTEAERIVRASQLPLTIVRPVELRNRAPRSGPLLNQTMPLSLLRTVSRELVAETLVACTLEPASIGRTFEVCEGGDRPLQEQLRALLPNDEVEPPVRTPLWG